MIPQLKKIPEDFFLGVLDFVIWFKQTFLSNRHDDKEISQLKKLRPKVEFENVVNVVCEAFGRNAALIITKGRKKNKASEVVKHLARELSGMSGRDLGLYFEEVSGALIAIMNNRIATAWEDKKANNK